MKFLATPLVALSIACIQSQASRIPQSWLRSNRFEIERDVQNRIVGGVAAGSYPAYAKLSADTFSFCGATLVHPDILVGAAHCDGFVGLDAYLGSNLVDGRDADEVIQVVSERIHPSYSDDESPDIMLYKLVRPSSASVVSMNSNGAIPSDGELVRTIGFGLTSDGGETSDILLQVDLNVVDFGACNRAYDGSLIDSEMVCAAAPGKDSCQNDSGGPLLRQDGTLVGIVSFGDGCAQAGIPGVYTRLSDSMDFVRQGICEMSSNPPPSCGTTADPGPSLTPPAPTPSSGTVQEEFVEDAGAFCFSGLNQVEVQGQGTTFMRDLKIGDEVESSTGFSTIYSLLHVDHEAETDFLKFDFEAIDTKPLEISPRHFVLANEKMVAAETVKVGDVLDGPVPKVVASISMAKRRGFFAPATVSGDLVVSGVTASNYVTFLAASAVHEHHIAHAFLAPLRWYCQLTTCDEETYTAARFSLYVFPLVVAAQFLALFPLYLQYFATALLAPAVGVVYGLDALFLYDTIRPICWTVAVVGITAALYFVTGNAVKRVN